MIKFVKISFIAVGALVLALLFYKMSLFYDATKDGKPVYQIEVNSFNSYESYVTKSYTRNNATGCIEFIDELGFKRTVCNNYTITEY